MNPSNNTPTTPSSTPTTNTVVNTSVSTSSSNTGNEAATNTTSTPLASGGVTATGFSNNDLSRLTTEESATSHKRKCSSTSSVSSSSSDDDIEELCEGDEFLALCLGQFYNANTSSVLTRQYDASLLMIFKLRKERAIKRKNLRRFFKDPIVAAAARRQMQAIADEEEMLLNNAENIGKKKERLARVVPLVSQAQQFAVWNAAIVLQKMRLATDLLAIQCALQLKLNDTSE